MSSSSRGASVYFKELLWQEDVPEALSEMRRRAKLAGKVAEGDREAMRKHPRADRSSADYKRKEDTLKFKDAPQTTSNQQPATKI